MPDSSRPGKIAVRMDDGRVVHLPDGADLDEKSYVEDVQVEDTADVADESVPKKKAVPRPKSKD